MEENTKVKTKKGAAKVIIILLLILICLCIGYKMYTISKVSKENGAKKEVITANETKKLIKSEYAVEDNNFSKFDLSFLKFENEKKNKIYSPLSIKYAFKMLSEATEGDAKAQIDSIIEAYNLTEYKTNKNMALSNAFFIRDTYKENIKESYIETLKTKYKANVEFDEFKSANKINNWVKKNTLNLISDILEDSDITNLNFVLINALGIDMDWNHKFLVYGYDDDKNITMSTEYLHERIPSEEYGFAWYADQSLLPQKFDSTQKVSSMQVYATINKYDIVKDLGEESIKNTVYEEFKKYVLETKEDEYTQETVNNDFSEKGIKKAFEDWFNGKMDDRATTFIDDLKTNYGRTDYSTDFSIYVNDDVKVFAKDLKEYDGTTLQYIGIMPIKEDLNKFIDHVEYTDITKFANNLKELKKENFKEGYLTYIHGRIPKFTFDYELNLKEDLNRMGITDVFEQGKANLKNMTDDEMQFIESAKHKANIEFTQDGIKAAAATEVGGLGAGGWFDYYFEIPTEDIDITFDKPYMFLIRDKKTGETWFVGTVYEPLNIKDEKTYMFDENE